MEETASSYCSGSPESKTTVFTPVLNSFDDCFTQVVDQYHYSSEGAPFKYGDGFETRQSSASASRFNKIDMGFTPYYHGITGHFAPCNELLPAEWTHNRPTLTNMDDWSAAATRYLKLGNVDPSISKPLLLEYLLEAGDVLEYNTSKLQSEGVCVVAYSDLRDAIAAYVKLQADQNWNVQYCSQAYYSVLNTGKDDHFCGVRTCDVICTITSITHPANIASSLYKYLCDYGTVNKLTAIRTARPPTFMISFGDPQEASDVADTLDGQYLMGVRLEVTLFEGSSMLECPAVDEFHDDNPEREHTGSLKGRDELGIWSPNPVRPQFNTRFGYEFTDFQEGNPEISIHDPDIVNRNIFSGMPSYSQPQDQPQFSSAGGSLREHAKGQGFETGLPHAASLPKSDKKAPFDKEDSSATLGFDKSGSNLSVPGKNIIDLDRIARGLDTRTTVMLRNIPNKVDQQTLKDYIDETSRGLYNFLYLRIDFRNICNVGYAFINFLDPLDIIDFVKEKSGTRWNKFNSEKVLDVTYANIQGIDQLVEKFRNSSVMDQDPAYRPKLFYSSGPLAGTEMEFPAANNILKKCRSISAAQQIGLFAPKLSAASKGVWRKRE